MSFDDDEKSEQDSEPIECFDIAMGPTTYRVTSGISDVIVNGLLYTAEAMFRDERELTQISKQSDGTLEILLRADHAAARRWFQFAIPPAAATMTVYRLQRRSGESEQFWTGRIVSAKAGGDGAVRFTVSSLLGEPIRKSLPVLTAGVQCGHVLYDAGCRASRSGADPDGTPFRCATTVLHVEGRDVRLDLTNVPAGSARRATWLKFGELVVIGGAAAGERRTIRSQTDLNPGFSTVAQVSLALLIPNLKVGDAIETYAGCQHDILDCGGKFANKHNYGGLPYMNAANPYRATLTGPRRS